MVEVSGANQYNTKPLALVSTIVPLTVVVAKAALLADEPDPAAAGVLLWAAGVLLWAAGVLLELAELPQAATDRAIAASPVTLHIFRIRISSPSRCKRYPLMTTYDSAFSFTCGRRPAET